MRVLILFLLSFSAYAEDERFYQEKYCTGEPKTLEDGTKVDCLTSHYAIEYDHAYKFYEAIGQALHYARLTGKKAGIVLIVESEKDCKYVKRAAANIDYYWLPVELKTVGLEC